MTQEQCNARRSFIRNFIGTRIAGLPEDTIRRYGMLRLVSAARGHAKHAWQLIVDREDKLDLDIPTTKVTVHPGDNSENEHSS